MENFTLECDLFNGNVAAVVEQYPHESETHIVQLGTHALHIKLKQRRWNNETTSSCSWFIVLENFTISSETFVQDYPLILP